MKLNIEKMAENKFEGYTRQELRDAGKALSANFAPNQSETKMRERLNQIIGQMPQPRSEDIAAVNENVTPIAKAKNAGRPRLNASDRWEGRRHRVTVHRGQDAVDHKSFVITWDAVPRAFLYGVEIDMPEPFFNIMAECKIRTLRQRKVKDEEDNWIKNEGYDQVTPRYSYNYIGVTPGTEELPASLLDYWQARAIKNNFFKAIVDRGTRESRHVLIQILADVTEPRGPDFYKDMTDQDILSHALRVMGFEDEVYNDAESLMI